MGWWRGEWIKALKLFRLIERLKVFSLAVAPQPQRESHILLRVLDTVTQQRGYKSTGPPPRFVLLFIARFSYALFSLILSHADFVCVSAHVTCVCVCELVSCAASRPLALPAVLSYNILLMFIKKKQKNVGLTPTTSLFHSLSLSFLLALLGVSCISIPEEFCRASGHGRYGSGSSHEFHCCSALKAKFIGRYEIYAGGQFNSVQQSYFNGIPAQRTEPLLRLCEIWSEIQCAVM